MSEQGRSITNSTTKTTPEIIITLPTNLLKVTNHLRQKQSLTSTLPNPPIHLVLRLQNQKTSPSPQLHSKTSSSSTGGAPTNRGPLRTTTTQKSTIHPSRVHPLTISTTTKPKETTKNFEKPTNGLLETSLVGLLTSVSVIFQTLYYFVLLLLIPLFLLHRLPPSQKTAASHRALSA